MLLPIFADPRVGETMGGVSDRERVEREAAGIDSHWEEHGFGYWLWFETATGEATFAMSRCGLARIQPRRRYLALQDQKAPPVPWPGRSRTRTSASLPASDLRLVK